MLRYVSPALWAAVLVRYALLLEKLPARARDWNFDLYYATGLAALRGIDPARDDIAPLGRSLGCHFPARYFSNATPFFRLIFAGLAHLSLTHAFWLWTAAGAMALAGAIAILLKIVRPGREVGALAVAVFLLYPPTVECFWYAEAELFVLFLAAAAFWWMRRDAEVLAGVALGLAALLKAYPALLGGYLIVTGRRRTLASAVITGVAGLAVAVWILGPESLTGFLFEAHETFGWSFLNLSLTGFLTRTYWRLFTVYANQGPRTVIILGAQIGMAALTWRTTRKRPADDIGSYGLWVITAVIDSPIVWLAYLALLAIPFAALGVPRGFASERSRYAAAASIVLAFTMAAFEGRFLDSRLWRVLSEGQFLALACAYASAYWLVADGVVTERRGKRAGHERTIQG